MATVVNVDKFREKFAALSWSDANTSEVVEALKSNSIPATQLIAYLNDLIATPEGLDDAIISGCPAANAAKITTYFKNKGVLAS